MRISLLAASVVSGAVAVAGCGTTEIDQKKAQKLIVNSLSQAGNSGTAKCPSGVKAKANTTFTCQISLTDGRKGDVTVHITSSKGHVQVGPNDYHVTGK